MSIFLHQNRAGITLSRPQPARKEGLLPPCLERTGSAQADGDEILAREMAAVVITTTAGPGQHSGQQRHPVICLPLDLLPGWLFNISPSRVKPEYRERVQRYRGLCYRALWRAFQRGELFPVEEPTSVQTSASTIAGSHDTNGYHFVAA